ncbi:MAG: endonuclease NucS [Acidobacteria bacterium]|nr:endonuclease NucS [Acidobacteriota bacterium]
MPGQTEALPLKEAYPFASEKGLAAEAEAIRTLKVTWPRAINSSVRRGGIVKLFQEKGVFQEFLDAYWPNGKTPRGQTAVRWYLRVWEEYHRWQAGEGLPEDGPDSEEEAEEQAFRYETDLRHALADNLGVVEKGLTLYQEDGRTGEEFPAGDRYVDILARDARGDFVVLELKVSRGHERALGQLLYYVAWVRRHLAAGRRTRGIIVAREISDELRLACEAVPDVELFEYEMRVTVRKVG